MPSRSNEPFGLSSRLKPVFFCMPTIATRKGGLPEIVEHEVNGLLVGAERPAEIADAICRLIEGEPSLSDNAWLLMPDKRRLVCLDESGS